MNPERGQLVQIRFYNGIFFDAIVEDWSDQKSVVKLTDSDDIVIIQKTLQDVMLVKIIQKKPKQAAIIVPEEVSETQEPNVYLGNIGKYVPYLKPIIVDNEVQTEFEKLCEKSVTDDSLQRMSELKDEINKIERKDVFGNINMFKPNAIRKVNYNVPGNIQISRAAQYTEEEVTSTNAEFDSELQNLFDEED